MFPFFLNGHRRTEQRRAKIGEADCRIAHLGEKRKDVLIRRLQDALKQRAFLLAEKMTEKVKDSATLRFLYNTVAGRIILKLLTACWVSKLCGAYLNSKLSKPLIKRFVKNS
jgi:hypothetical protein